MHKSLTFEIKKVMFYNFHKVPGHLLFDGGWSKGYLQGVFRGFYRRSFHVMVRAIYFVSSQSHVGLVEGSSLSRHILAYLLTEHVLLGN